MNTATTEIRETTVITMMTMTTATVNAITSIHTTATAEAITTIVKPTEEEQTNLRIAEKTKITQAAEVIPAAQAARDTEAVQAAETKPGNINLYLEVAHCADYVILFSEISAVSSSLNCYLKH